MAVANFALLSALLVVAHILRAQFTFLRRLYLPASLIAGILGFTVLSLCKTNDAVKDYIETSITPGWEELPSFLTNIVFVTLVLGESIPSFKEVRVVSGPQLCYAQVLAYGQYTVSAFLCWVWFQPVYDVDPIFAGIVPIGFEGGHGVAAGMKNSFRYKEATEAYFDLSMIAATMGLLFGTLLGWATVNIGFRKGLFESKKGTSSNAELDWWSFNGVYAPENRPPMGRQTVATESLDSLGLHVGLIGIAMTIGWLLKLGLVEIEKQVDWLTENEVFSNFPLFPFSLLGALLIQAWFDFVGKSKLVAIDRTTMERISGSCMDFLVMSAITELDVSVPSDSLTPFFICMVFSVVWSVVAMVTIGRLLPDLWLERALTESAMVLGATATALLVLRMIDPDNKTVLLRSFCFKQIIHVTMVGGGIFTSTSLLTLRTIGPMGMFFISFSLLLMWLGLLYFMGKRDRRNNSDEPHCVGGHLVTSDASDSCYTSDGERHTSDGSLKNETQPLLGSTISVEG